MSYVWINGELVDKSEAKISVFDHGFLYGDGVWDHYRVFNGRLFRQDFLRCLFAFAEHSKLQIPLAQNELQDAIEATARANNRSESYVRVIVTRGVGTLGPDRRKLQPQVLILAEEYHPYPAELYPHGLEVSVAGNCHDPCNPTIHSRTLGPLHLVWAKELALRHGCLDAIIFCGMEAMYAIEGNLVRVQSGRLRPNIRMHDALLDVIDELAASEGISIDSDPESAFIRVQLQDLLVADEVFIAGITCGVIAVIGIDHHRIGSGTEGPITKRIREAYRKLTRGEA